MGSGTEKRARNAHLTIRLTSEEKAAIIEKAERKGLEPGSFARELLLGAPAPRQVRRPPVEKRELARLLAELGKIGSNLNQLARATNTGEQINPADLEAALADLRQMRDAVLVALGREP